jgi:hypothetical protein
MAKALLLTAFWILQELSVQEKNKTSYWTIWILKEKEELQ